MNLAFVCQKHLLNRIVKLHQLKKVQLKIFGISNLNVSKTTIVIGSENKGDWCQTFFLWSFELIIFTSFFVRQERTDGVFICNLTRPSKGQLISKVLFCFFNSPKKRKKNSCPSRLGQKLTFSILFFGRIEDTITSFQG